MEVQKKVPKKRFYLIRELFSFMKFTKKWWMAPIIILLIVASLIIIIGQSSALSPFIYALF